MPFNPYIFVLLLLISSSSVFLKLYIYGLFLLNIIPCERRTCIVKAFINFNHQNLEILRMDYLFLLKSNSSYDRAYVIYSPKCSVMGLINKIATGVLQNIQISGQYLKFDEISGSANTCTCSRFRNFLIRKRALVLYMPFKINILV